MVRKRVRRGSNDIAGPAWRPKEATFGRRTMDDDFFGDSADVILDKV
jgi:hypothetical protein